MWLVDFDFKHCGHYQGCLFEVKNFRMQQMLSLAYNWKERKQKEEKDPKPHPWYLLQTLFDIKGSNICSKDFLVSKTLIFAPKTFWYQRIKCLLQRLFDIEGSNVCSKGFLIFEHPMSTIDCCHGQGLQLRQSYKALKEMSSIIFCWYLDHLFVCSECCLLVFCFVWLYLLVLHFFFSHLGVELYSTWGVRTIDEVVPYKGRAPPSTFVPHIHCWQGLGHCERGGPNWHFRGLTMSQDYVCNHHNQRERKYIVLMIMVTLREGGPNWPFRSLSQLLQLAMKRFHPYDMSLTLSND